MSDPKRILVLGGTRQARLLADALVEAGYEVTYSIAGVTEDPRVALKARLRKGGFGGADGLAGWCVGQSIQAVIDGTHPFAARMSRNAVKAAMLLNLPMLRLDRERWVAGEGDQWRYFNDFDAMALELLESEPLKIFASIGRQDVFRFQPLKQHRWWFRSVEPAEKYPLNSEALLGKGPFTFDGELALLSDNKVDLILAKDSGGASGYEKLKAANQLGLPVWLLQRPVLPPADLAYDKQQALAWVAKLGTGRV